MPKHNSSDHSGHIDIPQVLRDFVLRNHQDAVGVMVNDIVAEANTQAIKMWGYGNRSELIGISSRNLLDAKSYQKSLEVLNANLEGDYPTKSTSYTAIRKDGSRFTAEITAIPWMADASVIVIVIRDISQREADLQTLRESEKLYRTLVESMPAAAMVLDTTGHIIYGSSRVNSMTGFSPQEFDFRESLIHTNPHEARRLYVNALRTGGRGNYYECQCRCKDGSLIWISICWDAILDDYGNVKWLHMVFYDISAGKKMVESLKASETRYRAIVENQTEMVDRFLPDGTLTYVNEAVARYFAIPKEQLLGSRFQTRLLEQDQEIVREALDSITPQTPSTTVEHKVIVGDANRWLQWTDRGIYDDNEELIEFQAVGRDITPLKQFEMALKESEERFRSVIDCSSDCVLVYDRDLKPIYVNEVTLRMNGCTADQVIGLTIQEFLHEVPDIAELWVKRFHEVIATGECRDYDDRLDYRGTIQYTETHLTPIRDAKDHICGIALVQRVLTAQRLAQAQLKESEAQFRAIFDGSAIGVILADREGHCLFSNQAMQDLLGYNGDDLQNRHFRDFTHPDDVKLTDKNLLEMRSGNVDRFQIEKRYLRKDNTHVWARLTVSAVRDERGEILYVITMIQDITQARMDNENLIQSHADLERAYHLQREFLNNVTHEVRTPLTAVQGYAKLLLEGFAGPITDEQTDLLKKIVNSSDMLLETVSGVLEISRMKSGRLALYPRVCKPKEFVEKAISSVLPQTQQKGLELRLSFLTPGHIRMYDEQKMIAIVTNLLSNAVKFTDTGTIEVLVECQESGVQITVTDTGWGIKDTEIGTIFDEFQQLEHPRKHKSQGFGIGLAIVASLVDVLGGSLAVSSEPNCGTAFLLTIPASSI